MGLRDPERLRDIVSEILAALESEEDRLVIDCLLEVQGQLCPREAIPILAHFILHSTEDHATRFEAALSLGKAVNVRFGKKGDDAVQQACSWLLGQVYRDRELGD